MPLDPNAMFSQSPNYPFSPTLQNGPLNQLLSRKPQTGTIVDPKNPSSLPEGFPFTAIATVPKETTTELTPQSGGMFANLLGALGVSGPTAEEQAFLDTLRSEHDVPDTTVANPTEGFVAGTEVPTATINSPEFTYNATDIGKVPATTVASPNYNIEDFVPEQMKKKKPEATKNDWVSFDTPSEVFKSPDGVAPPPVKIPENIDKLVFSEELKKAVAYNLVKRDPNILINYPLNSISSVKLKLVTEKERELLNARMQQVENDGDRRRFKTSIDGYDETGKPFSRSDDYEEIVHVDKNRKIRYLELLGHVSVINEEALPSDLFEKDKVLREYSEEFLNLIYVKAVVPLKRLIKEVSDNFKDF